MLPLVVGQQQGWPAWSWVCLAAAAPGCWLFLTAQRRAAAAGRPVLVDLTAVRPAPVALGLIALAAATSTYFALLFTLAQYEQQGLGRSPVASGLMLVPWVAAFGLAGIGSLYLSIARAADPTRATHAAAIATGAMAAVSPVAALTAHFATRPCGSGTGPTAAESPAAADQPTPVRTAAR